MFISFEGIDGSGKSTQVRLLADTLKGRGHEVMAVREPGGTDLGERIRDLLLDPDTEAVPRAEVLLFSSARAQLVEEVIRPALDRGAVVIADRFFDSTTAYQGGGRRLGDLSRLQELNSFVTDGLTPDLTFLLDIDLETASVRRGEHTDRIETSGNVFYARVRETYLDLARQNPQRFRVLPPAPTPETTQRLIWREVDRRLP